MVTLQFAAASGLDARTYRAGTIADVVLDGSPQEPVHELRLALTMLVLNAEQMAFQADEIVRLEPTLAPGVISYQRILRQQIVRMREILRLVRE